MIDIMNAENAKFRRKIVKKVTKFILKLLLYIDGSQKCFYQNETV